MGRGERRWTDEQVETLLGNLLRAGVMLSAGVVLLGAIWYLLRHGASTPDYRVFRGEPSELRSVHGIVNGMFSLDSRGLIQFGLMLLIATPIARVAMSAVAFLLQRDRTYVVVTLIVLTVLLWSLVGSQSIL